MAADFYSPVVRDDIIMHPVRGNIHLGTKNTSTWHNAFGIVDDQWIGTRQRPVVHIARLKVIRKDLCRAALNTRSDHCPEENQLFFKHMF